MGLAEWAVSPFVARDFYPHQQEDYERICNDLFSTIYQIFFREEEPCLSPEGQNIVKAYRGWYMTPDGIYIRILGSTKVHIGYLTLYMKSTTTFNLWNGYEN